MARKYIMSRPGLFGMEYYYDENGKPIGKSRPGLIERTRIYSDKNGRYAGKSRTGFLSKDVYKDNDCNYTTSCGTTFGDIHFKNGTPIGCSRSGLFGSSYTLIEVENEIYEDELYEEELEYIVEEFEDELYEECDNEGYEEDITQTTLRTEMKKAKIKVLVFMIFVILVGAYLIVKL